MDFISNIPNEILYIILKYIDQGILGLVCWKWYDCIKDIQNQDLHTSVSSLSLSQYETLKYEIPFNANLMSSICKSGNIPLIIRLMILGCPHDTRASNNLIRLGNKDLVIYCGIYNIYYDLHLIENAILGTNNLDFVKYLVELGFKFDHKAIIATFKVNNSRINEYLYKINPQIYKNTRGLIKYSCKTGLIHNAFETIANAGRFEDQFHIYKYVIKFNFVEVLQNTKIANMIKYFLLHQSIHEDYFISNEMIFWFKNNTNHSIHFLLKDGYVGRVNEFIKQYGVDISDHVNNYYYTDQVIDNILEYSSFIDIKNFLLTYQSSIPAFVDGIFRKNDIILLEFMIENKMLYGDSKTTSKNVRRLIYLNNINLIIKLITGGYIVKYDDLIIAVGHHDISCFETLYKYFKKKSTINFVKLMKTAVIQERLDIVELILDTNSELSYLRNEMMETASRHGCLSIIQYGMKKGIKINKKYIKLAKIYKNNHIIAFFDQIQPKSRLSKKITKL